MFSRSLDKSYDIAGKLVPQGKELVLGPLALRRLRGLYRDCDVTVVDHCIRSGSSSRKVLHEWLDTIWEDNRTNNRHNAPYIAPK